MIWRALAAALVGAELCAVLVGRWLWRRCVPVERSDEEVRRYLLEDC